jgi:hypothetical protein
MIKETYFKDAKGKTLSYMKKECNHTTSLPLQDYIEIGVFYREETKENQKKNCT